MYLHSALRQSQDRISRPVANRRNLITLNFSADFKLRPELIRHYRRTEKASSQAFTPAIPASNTKIHLAYARDADSYLNQTQKTAFAVITNTMSKQFEKQQSAECDALECLSRLGEAKAIQNDLTYGQNSDVLTVKPFSVWFEGNVIGSSRRAHSHKSSWRALLRLADKATL